MSSRPPAPPHYPTTQVDAEEVRRMAEASRTGACVECARWQSETEAVRLELHRTHSRIAELEHENRSLRAADEATNARITMIGQVVARLAQQVEVLSGVSHESAG